MSRGTWELIKRSKNFYIKTYRIAGTVLLFSASLNILWGVGIFLTYFSQPEPDFYATSGVIPPIELTPLDSPNETSTALLASDLDKTDDTKVIPQ